MCENQEKKLWPRLWLIYESVAGIEIKFKNQLYPILISPGYITEMCSVELTDDGIVLGAAVTLTKLDQVMQQAIDTQTGILANVVLEKQ